MIGALVEACESEPWTIERWVFVYVPVVKRALVIVYKSHNRKQTVFNTTFSITWRPNLNTGKIQLKWSSTIDFSYPCERLTKISWALWHMHLLSTWYVDPKSVSFRKSPPENFELTDDRYRMITVLDFEICKFVLIGPISNTIETWLCPTFPLEMITSNVITS